MDKTNKNNTANKQVSKKNNSFIWLENQENKLNFPIPLGGTTLKKEQIVLKLWFNIFKINFKYSKKKDR